MCQYSEYIDENGNQLFVSGNHVIYGINRLGSHTRLDTLYLNSLVTINVNYHHRELGEKLYELSNHLGSVLVTISDNYTAVSNFGIMIDRFEPIVKNISDYYPFGSNIANRTWVGSDGLFGYSGMEKNKQIGVNGDCYNTYYRQLNTKLGKWLSVDPGVNFSNSSYCAMNNNPIIYNDPKGDRIIGSKKEKRELCKRSDWSQVRDRFKGKWFTNWKIYERSSLDLFIHWDTGAIGNIYTATPQNELIRSKTRTGKYKYNNSNSRQWHLYYHKDTVFERKTFKFSNKVIGGFVYPTTPIFTRTYDNISIGNDFYNRGTSINEYLSKSSGIITTISLNSISTKVQDYGNAYNPAYYSFFKNGSALNLGVPGTNVLPASIIYFPMLMIDFSTNDLLNATGIWRIFNGKVDACNGFWIKIDVNVGKLRSLK